MKKAARRQLVVSTTNKKKKKELIALLKNLNIEILTLDNFKNVPDIKEDRKTFEGNAVKKAVTVSKFTRSLTLADDSGLEVEALNGLPGVHSARFAGPAKSDKANIRKLLRLLERVPPNKRKARFACFAALAENGKPVKTVSGYMEGLISFKPRGKRGFGYDPVFYYPPLKKTLAQIPESVKNRISHRYKALRKIKATLLKVS